MDRHEWKDGSRYTVERTSKGILVLRQDGELVLSRQAPEHVAVEVRSTAALLVETLRLAGFKAILEEVALALGCLPTQFADAYGHVLERATAVTTERDSLAERVDGLGCG